MLGLRCYVSLPDQTSDNIASALKNSLMDALAHSVSIMA